VHMDDLIGRSVLRERPERLHTIGWVGSHPFDAIHNPASAAATRASPAQSISYQPRATAEM